MTTGAKWTAQEVRDAVALLPPVPDNEELWKKIWTRSIREFGLEFRMPTPEIPYAQWDEGMWEGMFTKMVHKDRIVYSGQTTVRLDVLDWYLKMPVWKENFDTEGWFGNDHPVLIMLPDGRCVIKDGNHRIISKLLSSDISFVEAYVMRGS